MSIEPRSGLLRNWTATVSYRTQQQSCVLAAVCTYLEAQRFDHCLVGDSAIAVNEQQRLAEAVRSACVDAALQAYEDAGINGLCVEGRWECAGDALRRLDLAELLRESTSKSA